ncbi:MAG: isochorismate synthase, partial [Acidimicrobiales bacterium]
MTNAAPRFAVRRQISPGPAIDPYALAGNTGILYDSGDRLLVGIGSALTLPLEDGLDGPSGLERIRRLLAAIPCDDEAGETGSAVMAFGALPFDRSEPTSLTVPELIYERRSNRQEWVTVIGRAFSGDPRDELTAAACGTRAASTVERLPGSPIREEETAGAVVRPLSSDQEFLDIVGEAVATIERGELTKVVLARQVEVDLEQPIGVPELLGRWRAMEPNCTVFSMPTREGQFVGASPELLVERHGDQVHCRPLAGSTGQMSEQDGADFRSSSKETLEHRLVAEAIGRALAPLCSSLDLPAEPALVRLHNIMHLGTSIHGVLLRRPTADHPDGEVPSALDLVSALHPTPAVGGVPTDRALDTIGKLECELRGPYAGPVGFVDGNGDGRWVVG